MIGLGDAIWDNWSEGLAELVAMGEIFLSGGLKLCKSGCGVKVQNQARLLILTQF